MMNI
ncbi:hypothetical protein KSF78_0009237 [Schistosoma japonicum]|jgi:hypothetical protein